MKIEKRDVNGVTILEIQGKVTIGEPAQTVRSWVHECLDQGSQQILVNLGGVKFIDSTGLSVIVEAHSAVTNGGGALKLLNVTKEVNQLLVITGLEAVLDCFEDEENALASFGEPALAR